MTTPRPFGPPSGEGPQSFNEIQFLSWSELKRMAPAIAGLESARLARVISQLPVDDPLHNALVRARFEIGRFTSALDEAGDGKSAAPTLAQPLRSAILCLALRPSTSEEAVDTTLHYVLDRLQYLHDRISLIY